MKRRSWIWFYNVENSISTFFLFFLEVCSKLRRDLCHWVCHRSKVALKVKIIKKDSNKSIEFRLDWVMVRSSVIVIIIALNIENIKSLLPRVLVLRTEIPICIVSIMYVHIVNFNSKQIFFFYTYEVSTKFGKYIAYLIIFINRCFFI